MKSRGIRISDATDDIISVKLSDILMEIPNGDSLYWSITYIDATGDLGEGKSMRALDTQINDSENGLCITWADLNLLSEKFFQVIDILIIGCKNNTLLCRYDDDQKMYETCDIVIEMIDSGYWQVFSNDQKLINMLAKKFKETKFLILGNE